MDNINNEQLQQQILEILEKEKKALSVFELEENLNLEKQEFKVLIQTLNKMEQELNLPLT